MPEQHRQINPYEPPTVGWTPPALAADTEFLFNDQCIAGIGTLSLPKICVLTGETEDLIHRVSHLGWCSRWIVLPRNLLMFFSCSTAIPAIMEASFSAAPGTKSFAAMISPLLAMAVVIGALVMLLLSLYVRKSVEVQWYVTRRAVSRHRSWCVAAGLFCLCGAAVFAKATEATVLGAIAAPAAIGAVIAVILARGIRSLWAAGEHEGLVLVVGFSDLFLKQVQHLVTRYNAREASEIQQVTPPN